MKNSSNPKIIRAADVEKLSNYQPRDMTGAARQQQQVKPKKAQMTAAELEKLQKQAYEEAFEQGKKEGFEFGHNEALEQYRSQLAEKTELLDKLLSGLDKPFENLDDQVENEVVELVISMVRQLIRREIKMDPGHIAGVVREAMSALPVANREVTLVLNPEDAAVIREVFTISEKEQGWNIVEDPVLNRGGCKVLAGDSQIDATLESRLDALIAPLLSDERNQEAEKKPEAKSPDSKSPGTVSEDTGEDTNGKET